jgi:hypothetical protein
LFLFCGVTHTRFFLLFIRGGSERSDSAKITSKTDATAPYLDLRFGWPMGVIDPTEKVEKEGKKKK